MAASTLSTSTSRRAILTAAVAAPALAAIGITAAHAAPTNAAATVSPELAQMIVSYDAARARADQFYKDVFNPATERHYAMIADIPHIERAIPMNGWTAVWTTAEHGHIAKARGIASIAAERQSQTPAWQARRKAARSFYAAHLKRGRAIARAGILSGAAAASEDEARECDPAYAAYDAIEQFPVRSLHDLDAKLRVIRSEGEMDGGALMSIIQADVARLAAREA